MSSQADEINHERQRKEMEKIMGRLEVDGSDYVRADGLISVNGVGVSPEIYTADDLICRPIGINASGTVFGGLSEFLQPYEPPLRGILDLTATRCHYCGLKADAGDKYCDGCGHPF